MIRSVSVRGRKVTIDWDQEDYDRFFAAGLQELADEHFGGERRVVVVPFDKATFGNGEHIRTVEVGDEFFDFCVGRAFNRCLKDHIERLSGKEIKGYNPVPPGRDAVCLLDGILAGYRDGRRPAKRAGKRVAPAAANQTVHKAVEKGKPGTLCGVGKPRATSLSWKGVNCARCRRESRKGIEDATR